MDQQKTDETLTFQAEVSRLLDIVAHSLYSQKEVFLRELISNASDACDRLRYAAITAPELSAGDADYRITLAVDPAARTLTVADNGIGMGREELVGNLGTIARSGTRAFVETLSGDAKKDVGLIGQFGVGFYSAFMVVARGRGVLAQGRRGAGLALGLRRQGRLHRRRGRGRRPAAPASSCIWRRARTSSCRRCGCARSSRPTPTTSPSRSCCWAMRARARR